MVDGIHVALTRLKMLKAGYRQVNGSQAKQQPRPRASIPVEDVAIPKHKHVQDDGDGIEYRGDAPSHIDQSRPHTANL